MPPTKPPAMPPMLATPAGGGDVGDAYQGRHHQPDPTSGASEARKAAKPTTAVSALKTAVRKRTRRRNVKHTRLPGPTPVRPELVLMATLLAVTVVAVSLTHRIASTDDINDRALNTAIYACPVAALSFMLGYAKQYVNVGGVMQSSVRWVYRRFGHGEAFTPSWIQYVGDYDDHDVETTVTTDDGDEESISAPSSLLFADVIFLAGAIFCTLAVSSMDTAVIPSLFVLPWVTSVWIWPVHGFTHGYKLAVFRCAEMLFMGTSLGCLLFAQPATTHGMWGVALAGSFGWSMYIASTVNALRGGVHGVVDDIDGNLDTDDVRVRCNRVQEWSVIVSIGACLVLFVVCLATLIPTRTVLPGGGMQWWDGVMCAGVGLGVAGIPVALMAWNPATLLTLITTLSIIAAYVRFILEGVPISPPLTGGIIGGVCVTWLMDIFLMRASSHRYAFRTFDM